MCTRCTLLCTRYIVMPGPDVAAKSIRIHVSTKPPPPNLKPSAQLLSQNMKRSQYDSSSYDKCCYWFQQDVCTARTCAFRSVKLGPHKPAPRRLVACRKNHLAEGLGMGHRLPSDNPELTQDCYLSSSQWWGLCTPVSFPGCCHPASVKTQNITMALFPLTLVQKKKQESYLQANCL